MSPLSKDIDENASLFFFDGFCFIMRPHDEGLIMNSMAYCSDVSSYHNKGAGTVNYLDCANYY